MQIFYNLNQIITISYSYNLFILKNNVMYALFFFLYKRGLGFFLQFDQLISNVSKVISIYKSDNN